MYWNIIVKQDMGTTVGSLIVTLDVLKCKRSNQMGYWDIRFNSNIRCIEIGLTMKSRNICRRLIVTLDVLKLQLLCCKC